MLHFEKMNRKLVISLAPPEGHDNRFQEALRSPSGRIPRNTHRRIRTCFQVWRNDFMFSVGDGLIYFEFLLKVVQTLCVKYSHRRCEEELGSTLEGLVRGHTSAFHWSIQSQVVSKAKANHFTFPEKCIFTAIWICLFPTIITKAAEVCTFRLE